ncbi:MAG: inositol monophosphatase family protein [Rhodobacteraceae bacterium]|nr:inositol monophosphatase family protein [Paracoccaceae bacterium]
MIPGEYLPLMINVAREAGKDALRHHKHIETMEVSFKGQADLLCEADEAVEAAIFKRLQGTHPNFAFQGEEGGARGFPDADLIWLVDPIDGTTNFLSGLPFAISIALVKEKMPLAGVIYSPLEDEMFSGAIDCGATLNGEPIRVRNQTDPARFVVGTGLPLDRHAYAQGAYRRLHRIHEKVAAVRMMGSCALSLASVASGRLDGYFEGPTGFLDCAAGLVILTEAGGIVTDFWGGDDYADTMTFTSGAPACQAFLLQTTMSAPRGRV